MAFSLILHVENVNVGEHVASSVSSEPEFDLLPFLFAALQTTSGLTAERPCELCVSQLEDVFESPLEWRKPGQDVS